MSEEIRSAPNQGETPQPSVDEITGLDRFLDAMLEDRQPDADDAARVDLATQHAAAQLRMAKEGAEAPSAEFLGRLERSVSEAITAEAPRRRRAGVSRGTFLRGTLAVASGAGIGIIATESARDLQVASQPKDLVTSGNERWYDIAAEAELPPGAIKRFTAGGLVGYLLNTDGRLTALSGICTHMGCLLKPHNPAAAEAGLRCLCHGSRFDRRGQVTQGLARQPLANIALHIENGRVYALGTRETV
jgi:cytochrome b6-f complex iron-sulfur subunit